MEREDIDINSELFAFPSTYHCATHNCCIPCLYKLFPSGIVTEDKNLPPNVRPETCPRSSGSENHVKLYSSKAKILTVGDGDLSFSRSLVQLGYANKLIATTHESLTSLIHTYPNAEEVMEYLRSAGVSLYHEVDATHFEESPSLRNEKFDIIIWNFPCVRVEKGADGQVSELEQNRILLRKFFQSVKQILRPGGEVHVAHKTIEPFSWWKLCNIADGESFHLHRKLVFDRCNYPGYINRKVLDRKSFPCHDARLYIFALDDVESHKSKLSRKIKLISMVNEDIIQEVLVTISTFPTNKGALKTLRLSKSSLFDPIVSAEKKRSHGITSDDLSTVKKGRVN